MAGFSTANNEHLIRSNIWSQQLKEVLYDKLMGTQFVRMVEFPDGDTLNIPSIGQAEVFDYVENAQIPYAAMDTGNFQFSITEYKGSATYITNKMKQDSYYTSQLVSKFVPEQARALAKSMEVDILRTPPENQTATSANNINGAAHRMIGSGTNETMDVIDFALALHSLKVANVPDENLVAIVDPSVEYKINTLTNIINVSNNPRFEGMINSGFAKGMRFVKNIFGFDIYVSNNLKRLTTSETIGSRTAATGVCNLFFSAAPGDTLPIIGSVRQAPKVDSAYNHDFQREEYVTTCRYGFDLYRPENMVVVITDTDQVA